MNHVVITGRLGRAPEVKFGKSGKAWVQLSVGVKDRFKVGEDWKEETYWATVPVFGKRAEQFGGIPKGTEVFVCGRLQENKWKDKNGVERVTTQIIASDVKLLSSPSGTAAPAGSPQEMPDMKAPF